MIDLLYALPECDSCNPDGIVPGFRVTAKIIVLTPDNVMIDDIASYGSDIYLYITVSNGSRAYWYITDGDKIMPVKMRFNHGCYTMIICNNVSCQSKTCLQLMPSAAQIRKAMNDPENH